MLLGRSAIPESLPHVSQSKPSALFASWRSLAVAKQRYSTNPESGLSDYLRHRNSRKPTAKVHQHTTQITPEQLYAEVRFLILDCAQRASYQSRSHHINFFCHPQFCFSSWFLGGFILVLVWFHPGFSGGFILVFGWFHRGFWVVSSWFWVVSSWFHPGVTLVLDFCPTEHDTHTTVILSTQTTFICDPLTSRPTQDQSICNLANCNNRRLPRRWACLQACCFPDSTGSDGEKNKQDCSESSCVFVQSHASYVWHVWSVFRFRQPCCLQPDTQKTKKCTSCRARAFAMQRTSTENIARVLGLDTKPQGDRNSSSHCRVCPSSSDDVRPQRPLAMQLHPPGCTSSTGSGIGTASPPPAAPDTVISAASSRLISKTPASSADWGNINLFQGAAEETLSLKSSCTAGCSSELVPLTNACNYHRHSS